MPRAFLRAPSPAMAVACELTYLARAPIVPARALAQHTAYAAALRELGAAVTVLPPLAAHADGAFVEDALVLLPELAIETRPGAASRRGETASLAALVGDRPRARIAAPGTLEGGDVLRVGRTLFVGQSTRSNAAGLAQLAALAEPLGYRVRPVAVHGALHLKTAVTALGARGFVANRAWCDVAALGDADIIDVDPAEPFAGNTLTLGENTLIAAAHPRTAARIAARGRAVQAVAIGEFAKAEAGLTCLSVIDQR